MKTDQELMDEHCAATLYDVTRDWRLDPRTAEDPDDASDVKPVEPKLTMPPKGSKA